MTLTERCAYIKGLAEGLGLEGKDTAEAKIIKALIELCSDMADEIDDIEYDIEELSDYCEELDEDLGDVEEVLLDLDEDEDEDEDDEWEDCDGDCDNCDCSGDCDECGDWDDEEYYEIICPSCGETVCFDESVNAEELACPACGAVIGAIVDEDVDANEE